jgi:hypothetical protein
MIGQVLDIIGVFDIDTDWHLERRMRYSSVAIDAFQDGMTPEDAIAGKLSSQFEVLHASSLRPRKASFHEDEIRRWENEGGHVGADEKPASYQFGKRYESDGTWTIYHVFTGQPAQYGTWEMKRLTRSVAERALRTINSPSPGE